MKKHWWNDKKQNSLFSNTQKQHKEKYGLDYGDDGYYGSNYLDDSETYDYGFKSKLDDKKDFKNTDYTKYHTTWRGYETLKPIKLSYRYIQQMASSIGGQSGIKVVSSNQWRADTNTKTLYYDPVSLMYGTKGELLSTLLHEVGKIKYSDKIDNFRFNPYVEKYNYGANSTILMYEGFRVDTKMLKEYPSAQEIYESNEEVIKKIINSYRDIATATRDVIKETVNGTKDDIVRTIKNTVTEEMGVDNIDFERMSVMTKLKYQEITKKVVGTELSSEAELNTHLDVFLQKQSEEPLLEEYFAEMLRISYNVKDIEPIEKVQSYVDATFPVIENIVEVDTTAEVVSELEKSVFPIIENLLKNQKQNTSESIKESFSDDSLMKQAIDEALNWDKNRGYRGFSKTADTLYNQMNGEEMQRGTAESELPKEWKQGDYNALKESVEPEIRLLTNRLTFIKREESVIKYSSNHRRGKLDTRKLYRFATGNMRLFKKKLPNTDTVRSFAFSLMIDVSGSMSDKNKIIHTTRALIVLAEVFEKFSIPYEVITFDSKGHTIKSFSQSLKDKGMKKIIGGLVKMAGGSTYLAPALETIKIKEQPENNKVIVVLSDGDTESHERLDRDYFIPLSKKGIKSMAIGLECGDQVETLCMGNSTAVEQATEMPEVFTNLLKTLIKR